MNTPLSALTASKRVKTAAGGFAMTDEEYNRRWFERLAKRTTYNAKGCFIWTGPVGHKGYIMHAHRKYQNSGHRIVYMLTHGLELATEQLVCHRCDNRRCWNPGHLFVGDAGANNHDCAAKGRHHNAVKTHCKFGHPYDEANTWFKVGPKGNVMRACLTCTREGHKKPSYIAWRREYQKKRRAEKRAQKGEQRI